MAYFLQSHGSISKNNKKIHSASQLRDTERQLPVFVGCVPLCRILVMGCNWHRTPVDMIPPVLGLREWA